MVNNLVARRRRGQRACLASIYDRHRTVTLPGKIDHP